MRKFGESQTKNLSVDALNPLIIIPIFIGFLASPNGHHFVSVIQTYHSHKTMPSQNDNKVCPCSSRGAIGRIHSVTDKEKLSPRLITF
jgi:hypothetical protein